MSFYSYRVVFCALFQRDQEFPIMDPVAWVIAFKLHGEGIRGSQALSIALQGWAPDKSFIYGPSIKSVPVVSHIFDVSSSTGLGIEGYMTCWKN